jgi:hypothetical protein
LPNGRKHDHPLTDILYWKIQAFSTKADKLIAEIVALGGQKELEAAFNLFAPPPILEFEELLQTMRDRLQNAAKDRGWEV